MRELRPSESAVSDGLRAEVPPDKLSARSEPETALLLIRLAPSGVARRLVGCRVPTFHVR
jgi:hypothetical protein